MLAGYTFNGARQLRMENEIGVVAPGKQADIVAVERDLFQEPPHRILGSVSLAFGAAGGERGQSLAQTSRRQARILLVRG